MYARKSSSPIPSFMRARRFSLFRSGPPWSYVILTFECLRAWDKVATKLGLQTFIRIEVETLESDPCHFV